MLRIIYDNHGQEETLNYHLGDPTNLLYYAEVATAVQADGEELQTVIRNFDNLPWRRWASIATWFGDTAKFILANF